MREWTSNSFWWCASVSPGKSYFLVQVVRLFCLALGLLGQKEERVLVLFFRRNTIWNVLRRVFGNGVGDRQHEAGGRRRPSAASVRTRRGDLMS